MRFKCQYTRRNIEKNQKGLILCSTECDFLLPSRAQMYFFFFFGTNDMCADIYIYLTGFKPTYNFAITNNKYNEERKKGTYFELVSLFPSC